MATIEVRVQRFSVISARPFDEVVGTLEAAIGRPEMGAFQRQLAAAQTIADVEKVVQSAIGPSGLMEFIRFDIGAVLRAERGGKGPGILRLVVGNPLIMKKMVKSVPDGASYAPLTILIDERPDGVHLSYDSMASYLGPYGSEEAMRVARDLDAKVQRLLEAAAG